jgi:hypothetical protein
MISEFWPPERQLVQGQDSHQQERQKASQPELHLLRMLQQAEKKVLLLKGEKTLWQQMKMTSQIHC